jgi:hypothetical protein
MCFIFVGTVLDKVCLHVVLYARHNMPYFLLDCCHQQFPPRRLIYWGLHLVNL